MARSGRIAAVTAGVIACGALFGAAAAALAALIGLLATGEHAAAEIPGLLAGAALAGAVLGAPLLPLVGWLFLRRVPVGLAALGTFACTAAGGVLGWILSNGSDEVWASSVGQLLRGLRPAHAALGAVTGFVLAAILLRIHSGAAGRAAHELSRVPRRIEHQPIIRG